MKQKIALLFCCVLLTLVAACGSTPATPDAVYKKVSDATLKGGDPVPAPAQDVVLTVTGAIGTTNADDAIEMDLPTIESVGLVDYTVNDPFENKVITYQGVLMSDLLKVWQVDASATTLHLVALNDYSVDVPIADIQKYPIIFALKSEGEYMPVATHGPAMLVYPYDHFEFDKAIYNDFWIWQIKSIEVR
jgi:hypothetical protein